MKILRGAPKIDTGDTGKGGSEKIRAGSENLNT